MVSLADAQTELYRLGNEMRDGPDGAYADRVRAVADHLTYDALDRIEERDNDSEEIDNQAPVNRDTGAVGDVGNTGANS